MSRRDETAMVLRGVRRFLAETGVESIGEFSPEAGRRIDLLAVTRQGEIWAIEVKSGLEDLRADKKWRGYLDWCDRFFFAVGPEFPIEALPAEVGVLRADGYDAAVLREAESSPLAPARRRAVILRFARDAAARLRRLEDPGAAAFDALGSGGRRSD